MLRWEEFHLIHLRINYNWTFYFVGRRARMSSPVGKNRICHFSVGGVQIIDVVELTLVVLIASS